MPRAKRITPAVLLETTAVILEDPDTKQQVEVKVLLEADSQRAYISERIRKFLNLSTKVVEDVNISTFGKSQTLSKSIDRILLVAKTNSHENILIKLLCLLKLCLPISSPIITFLREHFQNYWGKKEIDLLIGPDFYWSFVTTNIVKSGESRGLVAVETKFGWILSGCVGVDGKMQSVHFLSSVTSEVQIGGENNGLESHLKQFWKLENLGINKYEQSFCEEYLNTICRNEYNRYEVRLTFKENHPLIHDNFELWERRLLNLREELKDNLDLLKAYNDIFIEQKQNGIIEEVMTSGKLGETHYI